MISNAKNFPVGFRVAYHDWACNSQTIWFTNLTSHTNRRNGITTLYFKLLHSRCLRIASNIFTTIVCSISLKERQCVSSFSLFGPPPLCFYYCYILYSLVKQTETKTDWSNVICFRPPIAKLYAVSKQWYPPITFSVCMLFGLLGSLITGMPKRYNGFRVNWVRISTTKYNDNNNIIKTMMIITAIV